MNELELIMARLHHAITESGLSYAELSKRTGIPKTTLNRWSNGQIKRIPVDDIKRIADAVGISAKWIMGWSDAPTSAPGGSSAEKTLTESQIQLLKLLPDLNEDDIDDLLLLANSKAARHKSQDDVK